MTNPFAKLRARLAYRRWRRDLRTTIMPLGHGVVGVGSGTLADAPMVVIFPLKDGEAGPNDKTTGLLHVRTIDDLPPGSTVLTFTDRDAVWRFRQTMHALWTATFNETVAATRRTDATPGIVDSKSTYALAARYGSGVILTDASGQRWEVSIWVERTKNVYGYHLAGGGRAYVRLPKEGLTFSGDRA